MKQILSVYIFWMVLLIGCVTAPTSNEIEATASLDTIPLTDLRFIYRRIDFKTVPADTVLVAKYPFINTGKKDLIIQEIDPDCTCTGYTLDKKRLIPGDTGHIVLRYSTKNKIGNAKAYVSVTANTPTKIYSLEIAASVKD
jgi:hypothetical protein